MRLNGYDFKALVSYKNQKIYICICKNYKLYSKTVYWTFEHIKKRIESKLNILMLIKSEKKITSEGIYYKYTTVDIYEKLIFRNFLKLIETGKITIKFNVGIYNGKYKNGETHNHGTSFLIDEKYISFLYQKKNLN